MIGDVFEHRQDSMARMFRRHINVVSDRVAVANPRTGEIFNVLSDSKYHWIDDFGNIVGTDEPVHPGAGYYRAMFQ
jgi:hypothetical protein